MLLDDLLDPAALSRAVTDGYVRARPHPTLPLMILNYAEKAQYEHAWNDVTRQCRGLIYNTETGEVVARPWRKFFNYGEPDAPAVDLAAACEATDKMDGSLGILYPVGGGHHAVASRGSFTSEQAGHATRVYAERYESNWAYPGWTPLFEIVYPANRIVLDYHGTDDLVLLGAVHIDTGQVVGPGHRVLRAWPGPRTRVMPYRTVADALAAPPTPNTEGLVLRLPDNTMLKIKQPDYVALHRMVTGLNERTVWERLGAGDTPESICDALPDEFHGWVRDVAERLYAQRDAVLDGARADFKVLRDDPTVETRRTFAERAARSPHRPWLFMLLDGKDPSPQVWRTLRPRADVTLVATSEDVA